MHKKWEELNTKRYYEYINNIIETRGQWGLTKENTYFEKHHIVLECKKGSSNKDNIIYLYAKEHYTAHKILAEDNSDDIQVTLAWSIMAFKKSNPKHKRSDILLSAEEYEKCRIANAKAISLNFTDERKLAQSMRSKGNTFAKGVIFSEDEIKRRRKWAHDHSVGCKWWTNGSINKFCRECPTGYIPGITRHNKKVGD